MHPLKPLIALDSNLNLVEKYLDAHSRTKQEYLELSYQVCGILLSNSEAGMSKKESIQKVLEFISQQRTDWKHPIYDKYVKIEQEQIAFQTNPFEVEEGVLECQRCKSKRTISFQRQTRSADEMTSTFAQCVDCGKKWMNS